MKSNEIKLAFDNLEARASFSAGKDPLDRISLRDHMVEVDIGAFQSERGRRQRVNFNIVVEVLPNDGAIDDDVDKILSYDTLTDAISAELAAERMNLLETLAARIAERILTKPQAARVFVRIEKLDRGPGALGVEIVRSRGHVRAVSPAADDTPDPVIVLLCDEALGSAHLGGWIDQLQALHLPVIFCVEPILDNAGLQTVHGPGPKRRMVLLSYEEKAWMLADRDARCVVMETRTELDHAAHEREIAVWAPSKMVLDAVDRPKDDISDAGALARWLAGVLSARGILQIGGIAGRFAHRHAPEGALLDLKAFS